MRFPAPRFLWFISVLAFLFGSLCVQAVAQGPEKDLPTLTADQMRDLIINAHDISLTYHLVQLHLHPELLTDNFVIGARTELKFFIQLNNCNNLQINSLLDNEFEYPRIAEYYRVRAPQILAEVPTTFTFWTAVSLGQYDQSSKAFVVSSFHNIVRATGLGFPAACPVFRSTSPSNVESYLNLPFRLGRLPMPEEDARRFVDSLPNPANREVALKVEMVVSPDSRQCKDAATIRGEILNRPRAPGDILNPEVWSDVREQMQGATDQCVYRGTLAGKVQVAARPNGAILATFDPIPPGRGVDGFVYKTDISSLQAHGTLNEFAVEFPKFLERALAGTQMQVQNYKKEEEFILDTVKASSSISENEYIRDTKKGCSIIAPETGKTVIAQQGNFTAPEFGERYKPCDSGMMDVSKAVRTYDSSTERGLKLLMGDFGRRHRAIVFLGELPSDAGALPEGVNSLRVIDFFIDDDPHGRPEPIPPPVLPGTDEELAALFYKKQYKDAFPLSERLCAPGNQDACAMEGYLYGFGLGVPADPARGIRLMSDSCDAGNGEGCDYLGLAYLNGGPVPKNKHKAFELFTKSCNDGRGEGCLHEADYGADGRDVAHLIIQACQIGDRQFTTACGDGDGNACWNLSSCYSGGFGLPKDELMARKLATNGLELLKKACSQGDKQSCQDVKQKHLY